MPTNPLLHLDGLLVLRAMDELNVRVISGERLASREAVHAARSAAERNAELATSSGDATPCTNTRGDDGDTLMCERAAGHAGPCAALVLFPSPSGKFAKPIVTTDAKRARGGSAMHPEIIRHWTDRGARVSTVHPEYGELERGHIRPTPATPGNAHMAWRVTGQDWLSLGAVEGDYLTAEGRLLAATTWADEPTQFNDCTPAPAEAAQ